MQVKRYEEFVNSRSSGINANYCVIGLNGEAGEVAEWYKKFVLRGNKDGDLTEHDLKEELGDVLFYLTRLAQCYNWSLADIMYANEAKLIKRSARQRVMD